MRQYLTSLYLGDAPKLVLLMRRAGCATMAECQIRRPIVLACLQRTVLVTEAWIYLKLWTVYVGSSAWPWKLAILCDMRVPLPQRLAVAGAFQDARFCCLGEFFGERLRQHLSANEMHARELVFDSFY